MNRVDRAAICQVAAVVPRRETIRITLKPRAGDAPRTIDTPIQLKFRNNAMLIQPEGQATTRRGVDRALVRVLARAADWAARLESGEYASIDALARAEQRCERHAARIPPLAYLAPDLVAAILDGRQPPALTLAALTEPPLPLNWDAQRRRFASFA
jgi:site-specific DNA recombinase